jgi:hypothetical protein
MAEKCPLLTLVTVSYREAKTMKVRLRPSSSTAEGSRSFKGDERQ